MSKIQIGWAEEKFAFKKPVALMGQFAERISEYEEKPLTATALAISSDNEQMILCSTDLVSVSYPLVNAVKEILKNDNGGIDLDKIVISAIHTHTGPGYTGKGYGAIERTIGEVSSLRKLLEAELPKGKKYIESANISENDAIESNDDLLKEISSKIAKAIKTAWDNRAYGSYSNAFGRAAVGMCRRVAYSDGSAQMWGDTNKAVFSELEGGNDSGIELLYVFDNNKKLTGIVANLACPAQCVQHRLFISPDFWGEAKMLLRKHFGEDIFLLPLCSAAGDQCPVDLVRWVEPYTDVNDPNLKRNNPPKRKADPSMFDLDGMRKAGRRVANEIINVYDEGLDDAQSDVVFEHHIHKMQLPLRRGTLSEELEAKKEIRDYLVNKDGNVDFNDVANLQIHLGLLQRMKIQDKMDIIETEVHIMRLGTIAIATNPFELFLDYGNQIKARSLAEQTFIIQLANGAEGYLPTEKAEKGGHYSAFISSGKVGHIGGEQLVRETLTDINNMFSKKTS
ncbi:MAG: hypothetical protein J6N52_07850 [Clostridia bacterium]|nr:hypothetical protein [Clostridia bacterium]